MAINTLSTATLFMNTLDKKAVQEATTGWMDANAGQVIYNGGAEVKIPMMTRQIKIRMVCQINDGRFIGFCIVSYINGIIVG